MRAKKMPIGRDAGVPKQHPDRGHQTMDLQGAFPNLSKGHAAHNAIHGHQLPGHPGRPLPKLPKLGKIKRQPYRSGAPK